MEFLKELKYRYRRDVVWSDTFSFVILLLGALCLWGILKFLIFIDSPLILRRIILIFGVLSIVFLETYVIYKVRAGWRWWRFLFLIAASVIVTFCIVYMFRADDTMVEYWSWGLSVFVVCDCLFRIVFLPIGKTVVKAWKIDYIARAIFKWFGLLILFIGILYFMEFLFQRQYGFSIFSFFLNNVWVILPIVVSFFTFFATGFFGPKRNVFYTNQAKVHEEVLPFFKRWCADIQSAHTASKKRMNRSKMAQMMEMQNQIDDIVFVKGANNIKFMWSLLTYFSSCLNEPIMGIVEKEKLKVEIKEEFKGEKVSFFFDSACVCFAETTAQKSGTSSIFRNFTLDERGFDRLDTWAKYLSFKSDVTWEKYSVLENVYAAYQRKKN